MVAAVVNGAGMVKKNNASNLAFVLLIVWHRINVLLHALSFFCHKKEKEKNVHLIFKAKQISYVVYYQNKGNFSQKFWLIWKQARTDP